MKLLLVKIPVWNQCVCVAASKVSIEAFYACSPTHLSYLFGYLPIKIDGYYLSDRIRFFIQYFITEFFFYLCITSDGLDFFNSFTDYWYLPDQSSTTHIIGWYFLK